MLYELHEIQHAAFAPWRMFAQAGAALYVNPFSALAYSPVTKQVTAGSELFLRLTQRYDKPEFGLCETQVAGETVAVHEEIVHSKPFCHLLRFRRECVRDDPVVLLVAPMSGHHATLLRETVRAFLPEHDVYITDWLDARLVPLSEGAFHLDDYVAYVREFIRLLGPDVHVVAVCQPTVPVLAAISLQTSLGWAAVPVLAAVSLMAAETDPARPRSMVLMGGPIDTRRNPTAVNRFATSKPLSWFETRLIQRVPIRYPGALRRVYPGFLQHASFVAMNSDRHMESHRDFYRNLVEGDEDSAEAHRRFYDEYNAVMDLPAEFYLDTLRTVFQEHALPRGQMKVSGAPVDPGSIRDTALLTIEGELDDICGLGQTEAAHELCPNLPPDMHRHFVAERVGHYGLFSGSRFRERIYPLIRDFMRSQC